MAKSLACQENIFGCPENNCECSYQHCRGQGTLKSIQIDTHASWSDMQSSGWGTKRRDKIQTQQAFPFPNCGFRIMPDSREGITVSDKQAWLSDSCGVEKKEVVLHSAPTGFRAMSSCAPCLALMIFFAFLVLHVNLHYSWIGKCALSMDNK